MINVYRDMLIYLNDKEMEIAPGTTLEALLAANELDKPGMVAAIDGRAVRRTERAATILTEGVHVMVFKAVCGG